MERKKGFMEDGGGFDRIWDGTVELLRRFRDSRYGLILGILLVALVSFTFLAEPGVRMFRASLGSSDLHILLQREAGLPEAAGLSEAEYSQLAYLLNDVAYGWFSEKDIESFKEKFGYNPSSEQEMQLLLESNEIFDRLDDFLNGGSLIWVKALGFPFGSWLIGKKRKGKYYFASAFAGIAAALLPVMYFAIRFARDFRGTMLSVCDAFFSVNCRVFSPENSLLARLMPESVLRGIGDHILYELMEGAAIVAGIVLVIWLVVYLVEKISKREKEDNENENPEI